MVKTLSLDELRKMSAVDLQKEIAAQRLVVGKLRLTVKMGKEKGSHQLRRERTVLAQMLTILGELRLTAKPSRMPAPTK